MSFEEEFGRLLSFTGSVKRPNTSFNPPLYQQRYDAVCNALTVKAGENLLEKVVDVGCSAGKFISTRLKDLKGVKEIIGIDVDPEALKIAKTNTAPLIFDWFHPRKERLFIYLLEGNIEEFDPRLGFVDALTAIEIIEHLEPKVLDGFRRTVFGKMKPRIVVITTPNRDFNLIFTNTKGFRHPGHVFEFTRLEFTDWCRDIVMEFPEYSVEFSGVGKSAERWDLGPCSQIATFTFNEKAFNRPPKKFMKDYVEGIFKYANAAVHDYPFSTDDRSFDEKLFSELVYRINSCCRNRSPWQSEKTDHLPISLLLRFSSVSDLTDDVEVIRENLKTNGREVATINGEYHVVAPPPMGEEGSYSPCHDSSFNSSYVEEAWNEDMYEGNQEDLPKFQ